MTNCSDGGVIGPVVGIIACHQALETVKILSGTGTSFSGVMMVFDGLEGKIRNMRLRGRVETEVSKVTKLVDYVQFCGAAATDKEAGVRTRLFVLLYQPIRAKNFNQLTNHRPGNSQHEQF